MRRTNEVIKTVSIVERYGSVRRLKSLIKLTTGCNNEDYACNVLKEVRVVKSLSKLHGLDAIIITAGYREIPSIVKSITLVIDLINVVEAAESNVNVLKFYSLQTLDV